MKVVELPKPAPGHAHERCQDLFKQQVGRQDCEMVAAALVVVCRDGSVGTAYVSESHVFPLLGGVTDLQHRILKEVVE